MQLAMILEKVRGQGLTCSEVMSILMDQPTTPVGRHIESHAHMHMKEGFSLSDYGFDGDAFSLERKKAHWETDSHLYPSGVESADFGRFVYTAGQGRDYGYGGVMQDANRLPPTREYADRTGLDDLLRVVRSSTTTYTVWKYPDGPSMSCPEPEHHVGVDEAFVRNLTPVGKRQGHYQPAGRANPAEPKFRCEVNEIATPPVPKSPAHTMFPDGESLVMHLTAALNSEAGKMVLKKLSEEGPGSCNTVGIFSNSAARAVKQTHPRRENKMIERTIEVDMHGERDPVTGKYPATGRINRVEFDIDHVEAILGYRASGELNILTCYPSKQTTEASIGVPTSRYEDVAELVYRINLQKVTQVLLPRLVW